MVRLYIPLTHTKNNNLMMKLSVLLLGLVVSNLGYAKDYYNDNKYGSDRAYSNTRNEPKSYTLSGDRSASRDRYNSDSDRYPSRQSESVSGSYRSGNQINNNGLIINRE
jgi:hypothetical protein